MLIDAVEQARQSVLRVPRHAVEQALIVLVKNGLEAGPIDAPVRLSAVLDHQTLRFEVSDHGSGMDEETLRRAGEPFFTTKDPGAGMGLGIFLVRTLTERLNGRFHLSSQVGVGTRAILELPCQPAVSRVHTGSRG